MTDAAAVCITFAPRTTRERARTDNDSDGARGSANGTDWPAVGFRSAVGLIRAKASWTNGPNARRGGGSSPAISTSWAGARDADEACAGSSRRFRAAGQSAGFRRHGRPPAGAGVSGRRPAALGAGRPALRRALAAQLGPRRFHRSRALIEIAAELGGARRSGSIRCTRCSPTGPDARQPVCAEQPAVSQSALYRRRGG